MANIPRSNSDDPPEKEKEKEKEKPHFFKIILSTVLRDGKLGIPKRFARRYRKILSDNMFLKVSNGAAWKVGVTRDDDNEVWFQSGWKEFAAYYSVGYGHFLVFRYEGDSVFHVLIFDKTASEIEYPSTNEEPGKEESASVEILDVFPAREATNDRDAINITGNEEQSIPPLPPETIEIESDVSVGTSDVFPTNQNPEEKRSNKSSIDGIEFCRARQEVGALERASAYKPGNPFFRVRMGTSYIGKKRNMSIPMWFMKRHLIKTDNNCVTVWGRNGRTWSITINYRGRYRTMRAEFSSDWRIFVRDNQLKLGDVCVFELIKSPFILLKVVIFRAQ